MKPIPQKRPRGVGTAAKRAALTPSPDHPLTRHAPRRAAKKTLTHPRPTNGIFVAITVMNNTFASNGKLAIYTTARAT